MPIAFGLAHISHTFLLRGGQVLAWPCQTAQFDPQCINNTYPVKLLALVSSKQGLPGKDLPPLADHQPKMVPESVRNPD